MNSAIPHPFIRFAAYAIDLGLIGLIWAGFTRLVPVHLQSSLFLNPSSGWLNLDGYLRSVICAILFLILEPVLLASWGTTPGKCLMGLVLRQERGAKLTFQQSWKRSLSKFWYGTGAAIPIFDFVRMVCSLNTCQEGKPLPWDLKHSYSLTQIKVHRALLFALVFGVEAALRWTILHLYK